jgi:hypothetical protein
VNENIFWKSLDEILAFGEFIIAVPNIGASANSVGRDGREKKIEKDSCHCHIHLQPEKIGFFLFTFIDGVTATSRVANF